MSSELEACLEKAISEFKVREFSVPTGTEALFNNDLAIQNIISRVTGDSISKYY